MYIRLRFWEKMYLIPKIFIEDFSMFQTDQLYRTVARLQKRFQSFWIVILKVLWKKAGQNLNDFI